MCVSAVFEQSAGAAVVAGVGVMGLTCTYVGAGAASRAPAACAAGPWLEQHTRGPCGAGDPLPAEAALVLPLSGGGQDWGGEAPV